MSFVASWYWTVLMNFMWNTLKNVEKIWYLWHHGTEPFCWFSWENPQKNEMMHVIRGIVVLSRFDEFHGNYHEKCWWNLSFVASWYRAVLVFFIANTAKKTRWRVLFVASWYRAVFVRFMENVMRKIDNVCYSYHHSTELLLWIAWKIHWKNQITSVICSIMVLSRFGKIHGK